MSDGSHLENHMLPRVPGIFQRYRVILEFYPSFFMIKNWFQTKKHSCKFSKKLIVKKLQIGSNIIFILGMKIIHTCNFLIMKFYEKLQSVCNHKTIKKNTRWPTAAILKIACSPEFPEFFRGTGLLNFF